MKRYPPLERAITYIEAHLNEYIGLNEVSRETGYSYYYMTRLFSSVLGDPWDTISTVGGFTMRPKN